MIKEAVILAGGLGTRLREVVRDIPKSMAPVNGKPFLEYQLAYLQSWGIDHVVLSVGYKNEVIREHFGEQYQDVRIDYAIEEKPLGTGGGIQLALQKTDGQAAFILNGDTFFEVNLQRLHDLYRIKNADLCMALHFCDDVSRYGAVEIDDDGRITGFHEKGQQSGEGFMNGGVYYFKKAYFDSFDFHEKFSLEKDFFEKHYKEEHFYGLRCYSYFIDIGIPADYERAQDEFKALPY